MDGPWILALSVYFPTVVSLLVWSAITCLSAKSNAGERSEAFRNTMLTIIFAFWGLGAFHALFSGEIFTIEYWSWFTQWTFDFSWNGLATFLGIIGKALLYVVVFLCLVALTLWNVPWFNSFKSGTPIEFGLFAGTIWLDYAWLVKIPAMLF